MSYNPFDTPIGELKTIDLQKIIDDGVAEGYFVEYKRELPSNEKVGKSIASFANTYGGWYIIGVKTDEHNVANEICGFSMKDCSDPIAKIRDIIKSHIDPIPIFIPQVIALTEDLIVLVVHVPAEQETPFITKDGRIYRRNHDSSDPVPEANRYTIDRLVDAGRDVTKQFEAFCKDERTFSESEAKQGWIRLFLMPYPLGTIHKLEMANDEGIDRLIKLSQTPLPIRIEQLAGLNMVEIGTGNMAFDYGQPSINSIILRQAKPKRSMGLNLPTAQFFYDGRAKVFIPFSCLPSWEKRDIDQLESDQVKQALDKIWNDDPRMGTQLLNFFDIGQLWPTVIGVLNCYQHWLSDEQWLPDVQVALTIDHTWRAVPFFDLDEWGIHVQRFGLPFADKDIVRIPSAAMRQGLTMKLGTNLWLKLCALIALEFGLSAELFANASFSAMKKSAQSQAIQGHS